MSSVLLAAAIALSPQAKALDLQSETGSVEAMVKLRCSLDPKQEEILWWAGTLFAQEPGKKAAPLMGFEGYNICRAEKQADGVWRLYTRELTFYRDLKTGKILETWDNPISGERNTVVDVANDPVNHVQNPPGRPQMPLPWVKTPGWLMLTWNIPLAYPNPLMPEQFPRQSSGPVYAGSEHFMFFVKREDMENPAIKSAPLLMSWTRTGPWLPWMELGQRPGGLLYIAQSAKLGSLKELPQDIQDLVHSKYPEYATAPATWVQPNVTSWTRYKQLQQQSGGKD